MHTFTFDAAHKFRGQRHVPGIDADRRKSKTHGFLAELADIVARSFGFQQGVIDQSRKTGFQFNDRRAAGNAVGAGFDDRAGFSGAFLGAVQVAIRANFVVAGGGAGDRSFRTRRGSAPLLR